MRQPLLVPAISFPSSDIYRNSGIFNLIWADDSWLPSEPTTARRPLWRKGRSVSNLGVLLRPTRWDWRDVYISPPSSITEKMVRWLVAQKSSLPCIICLCNTQRQICFDRGKSFPDCRQQPWIFSSLKNYRSPYISEARARKHYTSVRIYNFYPF